MFELLLTSKLTESINPNEVGYTKILTDSKTTGDWGSNINLLADPNNNCIYLYGGTTPSVAINKSVGRYDIPTNIITPLAPMTITDTRFMGGVLLDNKIYAFKNDLISIYDIDTNTWSTRPGQSASTAFYFERPTVCLVNRDVYLFGYPPDYNKYGMILVKYSIDTNSWTLVSTLRKLPLSGYPSMVYHNGELFITGGDANNTLTTVYNIAGNSWRTITGNESVRSSDLITTDEGMYSFYTGDTGRGVTCMTYSNELFKLLPGLTYESPAPHTITAIGKVAYMWCRPIVGGNYRFTSYRVEAP